MLPFFMCIFESQAAVCYVWSDDRFVHNFLELWGIWTYSLTPYLTTLQLCKMNNFFLCIYWCIYDGFPQSNFFTLELKNGFLRLMYDFGFTNGPVIMESNLAKLQINDARYHEVMLSWYHFQGIHQVISLNIMHIF